MHLLRGYLSLSPVGARTKSDSKLCRKIDWQGLKLYTEVDYRTKLITDCKKIMEERGIQ